MKKNKYFILIFILFTTSLIGETKEVLSENFFTIETYQDYQRLSNLKNKIELFELIEDRLIPLTDNEILDSKMDDIPSWYAAIQEMRKCYEEIKTALLKYSNFKDPDIKCLYHGANNFLDNQGKILQLISESIEKNPNAKSTEELPIENMSKIKFCIFKIKVSDQTKKFFQTLAKVRDELYSYADSLDNQNTTEK